MHQKQMIQVRSCHTERLAVYLSQITIKDVIFIYKRTVHMTEWNSYLDIFNSLYIQYVLTFCII